MGFLGQFFSESFDKTLIFKSVDSELDWQKLVSLFCCDISDNYKEIPDLQGASLKENPALEESLFEALQEELRLENDFADYILIQNSNARLCGFMSVRINVEEKYAVLYDIVIDNTYQRQAVGKKAYAWLEEILKKNGINRLLLESGIQNRGSLYF